jgi:hypothetical protein
VLALPRQDELRWKGKGMTMSPQLSSVPPQSLGSIGCAVEAAATARRAATRRQKRSGGRRGAVIGADGRWPAVEAPHATGPLESIGAAVLPGSCRWTELGAVHSCTLVGARGQTGVEDLLPEWSWSSSVLGDQTSNGCQRLLARSLHASGWVGVLAGLFGDIHVGFLYTFHVYALIKFIKNLKKYIHVIFIIFYLCLKIQVKTYYILSI